MEDLSKLPPAELRAKLDEIEKKAAKAFPGPWAVPVANCLRVLAIRGSLVVAAIVEDTAPAEAWFGNIPVGWDGRPDETNLNGPTGAANATFIAASRTDVPALVALARKLLAERDAAVAERDALASKLESLGKAMIQPTEVEL